MFKNYRYEMGELIPSKCERVAYEIDFSKKKAILFDLDGTLIDTAEANRQAYNLALRRFNLQIDETTFQKTVGQDSRFFLNDIFRELTLEEMTEVRRVKQEVYPTFFNQTQMNEKLKEIIDDHAGHKKYGIVTNGKKENTFQILRYHKIYHFFELIITGTDVENPKPDPEGYLLATKILNMSPIEILAFEDSRVGISAANSAGLSVVEIDSNWASNYA
jgi:hypothetical protein